MRLLLQLHADVGHPHHSTTPYSDALSVRVADRRDQHEIPARHLGTMLGHL